MSAGLYTTQLQAGLGMVEETQILLDLWHDGMGVPELQKVALEAGQFPNMSARRLRNVVAECFAPRFLNNGASPAGLLKKLRPVLTKREFEQLLYLYACRANPILYDFVEEVYWRVYSTGRDTISYEDAKGFVYRANQEGKTKKRWSEGTITRVAGYLTGTCADFGLLERGSKPVRQILPFHMEQKTGLFLAYDLHSGGVGDNRLLAHDDWGLFGLDRQDVLEELKRLALQDWLIIQSAGNVIRIDWRYKDMEALTDAIGERKL